MVAQTTLEYYTVLMYAILSLLALFFNHYYLFIILRGGMGKILQASSTCIFCIII